MRARLPLSRYPITRDADLDFGLLHRLDVPSSGLLLCGTTFTGLLSLRWQLDTYRIERQYVVWAQGLASSSLHEVAMHIDPKTILQSAVSPATAKGYPRSPGSLSWRTAAHQWYTGTGCLLAVPHALVSPFGYVQAAVTKSE